jgi:dihydrofolate reductase
VVETGAGKRYFGGYLGAFRPTSGRERWASFVDGKGEKTNTQTEVAMRKLILKMSISIDGFVGGANGEIGWIFKSMDAGATAWTVETLWQAGLHLMGSRTYYDMAAYWPTSGEPFAAPMNEIPKGVFTRHGLDQSRAKPTMALKDARAQAGNKKTGVQPVAEVEESWQHPTVFREDLAQEIARLKAQPGKDLLAHGGAAFAQSLVRLGLVDEYRLLVHPVVLGRGLPLFGALEKPVDLQLESTTPFAGGAVAQVYKLAELSLDRLQRERQDSGT